MSVTLPSPLGFQPPTQSENEKLTYSTITPKEVHVDGQLVYSEGRKIGSDYCVCHVYENAEQSCYIFAVFELETGETSLVRYSYHDFDDLFKYNRDLMNRANQDARFHWLIGRLDFLWETPSKRVLAVATEADVDPGELVTYPRKATGRPGVPPSDKAKIKSDLDKEDEFKQQAYLVKSERARRVFLQELKEKRRIEQMKAAARSQKLDTERAERIGRLQEIKRVQAERCKEAHAVDEIKEAKKKPLWLQAEEERKKHLTEEPQRGEALTEQERAEQEAPKQEELAKKAVADAAALKAKQQQERDRRERLGRRREDRIQAIREMEKQRELEYLEWRDQKLEEKRKAEEDRAERKAHALVDMHIRHREMAKLRAVNEVRQEELERRREAAEEARDRKRRIAEFKRAQQLKAVQREREVARLKELESRKRVLVEAREKRRKERYTERKAQDSLRELREQSIRQRDQEKADAAAGVIVAKEATPVVVSPPVLSPTASGIGAASPTYKKLFSRRQSSVSPSARASVAAIMSAPASAPSQSAPPSPQAAKGRAAIAITAHLPEDRLQEETVLLLDRIQKDRAKRVALAKRRYEGKSAQKESEARERDAAIKKQMEWLQLELRRAVRWAEIDRQRVARIHQLRDHPDAGDVLKAVYLIPVP
ncbi:unnamed protein product [Vitrella brassicaformis CCMP3155]|uniref:Uncharacterized protein n=2 Tax=Vitrella brassicaformis TaxID=1169539 RepID=A0A0G4F761_VITBC|nr:unnamed protein product [Vitrella brassicaformis CCMP3155]|eukprot:CEM08433.1 unnamed protein product [Vitrella brassicaformis CCMP3155]